MKKKLTDPSLITDTERWRSAVIDRINTFNVRLMRVEIILYLLAAYLLGLRIIPVLGAVHFP